MKVSTSAWFDRKEAERAIFKYIEIYYNRKRKHSSNAYKAPALFEEKWRAFYKVALQGQLIKYIIKTDP